MQPGSPIWNLFRQFVAIGLQSFGGGATTLYLMRRVAVEEQRWVSDAEYTAFWGMVQIAPGINLLGQSVLIGHKVAGLRGSLIALAGLLLPSTTLTVALTAGYAVIRTNPLVMAAVHAIIPATVGIGCVLAYQMLRPVLQASRSEGMRSLVISGVVVIAAPVLLMVVGVPAVIVLWGAGVWCALGAAWLRSGAD
jgi:chromate transporter